MWQGDFRGANFFHAYLEDADFSKANLQLAYLFCVSAPKADFFSANLQGITATTKSTSETTQTSGTRSGSNADCMTNFENANFREAHLEGADLGTADLREPIFGARICKVRT